MRHPASPDTEFTCLQHTGQYYCWSLINTELSQHYHAAHRVRWRVTRVYGNTGQIFTGKIRVDTETGPQKKREELFRENTQVKRPPSDTNTAWEDAKDRSSLSAVTRSFISTWLQKTAANSSQSCGGEVATLPLSPDQKVRSFQTWQRSHRQPQSNADQHFRASRPIGKVHKLKSDTHLEGRERKETWDNEFRRNIAEIISTITLVF